MTRAEVEERLTLARKLADEVRESLQHDTSADGWLRNYRLTEAGLQLGKVARDLSER